MIVGIPKESSPSEKRVALIPTQVAALVKAGIEVWVEAAAGDAAGILDSHFVGKGATIVPSREELFQKATVLLMVRAHGANPDGPSDLQLLNSSHIVIGLMEPLSAPQAAHELAQRGVTAFSMELIPRITRAQSMDALSSMATIAGYKAVLHAAEALPRMFPMLMTAAGTLAPAKVFIVGVGVAGLQAIATARRLGAVVEAYDIRSVVKEQVQSVGAKFVELDLQTAESEGRGGYAKAQDEAFYRRQREAMAQVMARNDVVITTAAVPGRRAPVLVTAEMVHAMSPGSVIVDLAAERGGNCELTRRGETVVENGVKILGPVNLPAEVPYHASQMYSKNIYTFLDNLLKEGQVDLNMDDEIIAATLVTQKGGVVHPDVRDALGLSSTEATIGSDA